MTRTLMTLAIASLALVGCKDKAGDSAVPTTGDAGSARGQAQYEDAETNTYSAPREPAQPEPQTCQLEVVLDSSASFTVSDPACEPDALTGDLLAFVEGDATIDEDGAYVGGLFLAEYQTPSGCTVPDAELSAVNGVTLRALLANTSENCTTYCEAKARSEGETACAGDPDEAFCRSAFEASYTQDCTETCTTRTVSIAAESTLGLTQTADVSAEMLATGTVGTLEADLTFDHMVDENGEPVADDGA